MSLCIPYIDFFLRRKHLNNITKKIYVSKNKFEIKELDPSFAGVCLISPWLCERLNLRPLWLIQTFIFLCWHVYFCLHMFMCITHTSIIFLFFPYQGSNLRAILWLVGASRGDMTYDNICICGYMCRMHIKAHTCVIASTCTKLTY